MFDADNESTPESLATVLSDATAIGLRISSPSGASSETIAFDDIELHSPVTAVPEPTSIGLMCAGIDAATLRHHQRAI